LSDRNTPLLISLSRTIGGDLERRLRYL